MPLYCCHYRLRHAAACGAALVNRLSKRYSPLQQDDSNLNFLSSFFMRALMHMRGSQLSHTTLAVEAETVLALSLSQLNSAAYSGGRHSKLALLLF